MNINKNYFTIPNYDNSIFYKVPDDKEGEKVKFTDKKSINNLLDLDNNDNLSNIIDLKYTIQLFSSTNYENINNYIEKILKPKSEIIAINQIYVFAINSQIGKDYFITYKSFDSKIEAMSYCKKLSFIKKCLIINPQN